MGQLIYSLESLIWGDIDPVKWSYNRDGLILDGSYGSQLRASITSCYGCDIKSEELQCRGTTVP